MATVLSPDHDVRADPAGVGELVDSRKDPADPFLITLSCDKERFSFIVINIAWNKKKRAGILAAATNIQWFSGAWRSGYTL